MTEINADWHTLVVTPDPDTDLFNYEVICPGVTDACRLYEDCQAGGEEVSALDAAADGKPVHHGKRHIREGGPWMAETDRCIVAEYDGMPDAVAGRFPPGRHPIDFDYVGDGEVAYFPLTPAEATR